MAKYQVGDVVRIKPDLKEGYLGSLKVTPEMVRCAGDYIVIREASNNSWGSRYRTDGKICDYYFSDDCFADCDTALEDKKPGKRFHTGQLVIIRNDLKEGFNKDGTNWVSSEMGKYAGKIARIVEAHAPGRGYSIDIDIDSDKWRWYGRCLEPYFDWAAFEKYDIVVNLRTEKAIKRFMKLAERHGYTWRSGHKLTDKEALARFSGYFGDDFCLCVSREGKNFILRTDTHTERKEGKKNSNIRVKLINS